MADAGGKVAILNKKAEPPLPPPPYVPKDGERCCYTCAYNPSGSVCQEGPMDLILLPRPDGQLLKQVNERFTPPNYRCARHTFNSELPKSHCWGVEWADAIAHGKRPARTY
jgi:hypothetical protein